MTASLSHLFFGGGAYFVDSTTLFQFFYILQQNLGQISTSTIVWKNLKIYTLTLHSSTTFEEFIVKVYIYIQNVKIYIYDYNKNLQ